MSIGFWKVKVFGVIVGEWGGVSGGEGFSM